MQFLLSRREELSIVFLPKLLKVTFILACKKEILLTAYWWSYQTMLVNKKMVFLYF